MESKEWAEILKGMDVHPCDYDFVQLYQCPDCGEYDNGAFFLSWAEVEIPCWNCKGTMEAIIRDGSSETGVFKLECSCGTRKFIGLIEDSCFLPFHCGSCHLVCEAKRDYHYKLRSWLKKVSL